MTTRHTLLLVDDEPDNYDVAASLLPPDQFELHYANSAERARLLLRSVPADLILLDVMMPGTDGVEFCRQVKADPLTAHVPVLMSTALHDKGSLARCFEAGADDFISKPLSGLEVRARVRAHLRVRDEMAQTRARLRHQERILGELRQMLTSSLPHELRTPLNGIVAPIELLRDEAERLADPALDELVGLLDDSSARMHRIVERLLLYLHLEARRIDPTDASPTDATCALPDALRTVVHELAASHGRRADLRLGDVPPNAVVPVEPSLLHQLLSELLDNAFKFSPRGTPVRCAVHARPGQILLEIEDRGPGLGPDQLARVGAFMQFDRGSLEQQGLGLGLAIAHAIVDLLDGARLTLDERCTDGTRWLLRLPLLCG